MPPARATGIAKNRPGRARRTSYAMAFVNSWLPLSTGVVY